MLQNRVDPYGQLIKTAARGYWMGNRGIIHDDHQTVLRPFKLKAWITCKLEFKARKRKVMSPSRYTELFFLDEVTAFAAGHRPCFECRRTDFNRFKSFWLKGNPKYHFNEKTPISEIDEIIHKERIDRHKSKVSYQASLDDLPNGTFVSIDDHAYLVLHRLLFLWSPFGYEKEIAMPETGKLTILTPRSIVNTFRAGYLPQMAVIGA
jgi:hypothetical protein